MSNIFKYVIWKSKGKYIFIDNNMTRDESLTSWRYIDKPFNYVKYSLEINYKSLVYDYCRGTLTGSNHTLSI